MMTSPGVLIFYKPKGMTSFQSIDAIKHRFNVKKIGHAGTLDPMAEGILPVLFNDTTKLSSYIMDHDKEYSATFKLGVATDTYDNDGRVVSECDISTCDVSDSHIVSVLQSFVGLINQTPPAYSAIKINGVRSYEHARNNHEIELPARPVMVHSIALHDVTLPFVRILVACGKGCYIRSLVHDVGEKLGTHATLTELIRTRVGNMMVRDSVSEESLSRVTQLEPFLKRETDILSDRFERIIVSKETEHYFHIGNITRAVQEVLRNEHLPKVNGKPIQIVNEKSDLIALVTVNGHDMTVLRVFNR